MSHVRLRPTRMWVSLFFTLGLLISGASMYTSSPRAQASPMHHREEVPVQLQVLGMAATISNDIYTIKFNSSGTGYSLVWHGQELIGPAKGFYSSINGGTGFSPTQLQVFTNTKTMADIAYISTWGELHYVVRTGVSGLYSYFVATGIGNVGEFRTLYRVDGSIFRNGSNAERSGPFPTLAQIQQATKLQDETFKLADGTIYTKYNWATYVAQDRVHGVYGTDTTTGNNYGVWMISPSHEYFNGGPMKQELMVHVESATGDGVVLNMLSAGHFGTPAVTVPSGKIYGPWLVYFNNGSRADADAQASEQVEQWPYKWLSNPHYPLARTTVTGTLQLAHERPAAGATVVLAQPGGDIYSQGTDYIYYAKTDSKGHFVIPNVRPQTYSLYAYSSGGRASDRKDRDEGGDVNVVGTITDQFERDNVKVSGRSTHLGEVAWSPPNNGRLLWQIGTADRKATEFKLGNLPRQYGLFNQTPANLTYTIGKSTPPNDWYYAQTQVGTWAVDFNLKHTYTGTGHLTVALAGETRITAITVSVNGKSIGTFPSFPNDAAIYRSANQSGSYHLVPFSFPASLLQSGANTVTFQATNVSGGGGVMYDTVKLEVG